MKNVQLIQDVESKIKYHFKNSDLLLQAFTKISYAKQFGRESNEILEFIGDKVLDLMVIKILTDQLGYMKSILDYYKPGMEPDEFCISGHHNEEDFNNIKQSLVSNEHLESLIDKWNFAPYLLLGDSDIHNDVASQKKAKADLFEAIIGAVTIDSNWDIDNLKRIVFTMLELDDQFFESLYKPEEKPTQAQLDNPVSTLKEFADKGYCSPAEYIISNEATIDKQGNQIWSCNCSVRSWGIGKISVATSKKEAKKHAAYQVLCERYHISVE